MIINHLGKLIGSAPPFCPEREAVMKAVSEPSSTHPISDFQMAMGKTWKQFLYSGQSLSS
jgi:hypothetical protein